MFGLVNLKAKMKDGRMLDKYLRKGDLFTLNVTFRVVPLDEMKRKYLELTQVLLSSASFRKFMQDSQIVPSSIMQNRTGF